MPILVDYNHILYYFLNVLNGCLKCPIHLRAVRRGIMLLNLETFSQVRHHLVVEIRPIVCYDILRDSITINDILLDKPSNHLLSHVGVGSNFHPLGEVINNH